MQIKQRLKNVGFWVSLGAAIVLILDAFGVSINVPYAQEVINTVCSSLVLLGLLNDPTSGKGYLDGKDMTLSSVISSILLDSDNGETSDIPAAEVITNTKESTNADSSISADSN